jgi:hypothetical protein
MQFVSFGEMQGVDVQHALQKEGEGRWKTLGHVTLAFNLMWYIKDIISVCTNISFDSTNKLCLFSSSSF